jgi:hypothetical protein
MMKEPEAGTDVFAVQKDVTVPSQISTGFALDATLSSNRSSPTSYYFTNRLVNGAYLTTQNSTEENGGSAYWQYDHSDGIYQTSIHQSSNIWWMFKRAKGYFDVCAYSGDGVNDRDISHSLSVSPEFIAVKCRNAAEGWLVYTGDIDDYLQFNSVNGYLGWTGAWGSASPTTSVFSVGSNDNLNNSSNTYIAYLFATLAGVSKVGSFTGNGSNQNIACGFSAGARFVLIKRTDSTGDWYIWDTERGIVSGNDPHLSLNTTSAEVTSDDSIDPQSAGFTVNQVSATNINVSSGEYIFLAIA